MEFPKIYVISLRDAIERRQRISSQFDESGLQPEFVDAVDGRNGREHPLFIRYNEKKRVRWKGVPLSGGQLGCFASHYLMWQTVATGNEPVVILEDDARIDMARFQEFLRNIQQAKGSYECVRLFRNKSRRQTAYVVENLGDANICKFTKGHMSTTGYYLTPVGAKKLIQHAREWLLPVDMYMDQFWRNGVECYGLLPPCLTNDTELESMIGYAPKESKAARTYLQRLRREMFAMMNNLLKSIHNLRFRLLNPRLERFDEGKAQ